MRKRSKQFKLDTAQWVLDQSKALGLEWKVVNGFVRCDTPHKLPTDILISAGECGDELKELLSK